LSVWGIVPDSVPVIDWRRVPDFVIKSCTLVQEQHRLGHYAGFPSHWTLALVV
jgi:hypothetical protein